MLAVVFNKRRGNVSNLICGIVRLMALRALITSSLELESMQGRHSIPAAPMLILELQTKVAKLSES